LEKWTRTWQQVVHNLKKIGEKTDASAKRVIISLSEKLMNRLQINFGFEIGTYRPKLASINSQMSLSLIRSMRSTTELSSSRSSFATVTSEPTPHGRSLDERSEGKKCLCGKIHKSKECEYIVPEILPKNWKGDSSKVQKEEE
jgi:hypothetical protein